MKLSTALVATLASTEVITATAEAPSGKVKMEFEKKGEGYQVVLQAKSTPEAKTKNFRIKLQLYICKGCGNAEYACTCDE